MGISRLIKTLLSKHSSLLASQLVLGSAVTAGKLESLKTFNDNPNAAGSLQGMIDVDELTDETLMISCTGPFPEELPVISCKRCGSV